MSTVHISNLAYRVIKETFGQIVADILQLVIKTSIINLKEICKNLSSTPKSTIKKGILILLHHHFLTWSYLGNIVYYEECSSNIIGFMRCQPFMLTTREKYGKNAETLVDAVLKEGSATASQAVINAWIKITKYINVSTTIETLVKEFQYLVDNQYLQRCPKANEGFPKNPHDLVDPALRFSFSADLDLIMSIKQETSAYKDNGQQSIFPNNCPNLKHPDANVYWRLNYKRFDVDLRDKMIRRYLCDSVSREVGPIFDAMLKIGYKHCGHWEKCIGPVSIAEIKDKFDFPYLMFYLLLMNKGRCKGILERISDAGGGQYLINMEVAVQNISESILNSMVLAQFGPKVHRVYRTVRMEGMLEKPIIEKMTMIGPVETNKAISSLLDEMYMFSRELRKGSSITAASGNIYILYYIDIPFVINTQHATTYKIMFNITVQLHKKLKENQTILEKRKKIDVLIDHFKVVNPGSVKELEEMLSPEELEKIEAVNASLDKYIANIVKLQSQAFIFELFSFYKSFSGTTSKLT